MTKDSNDLEKADEGGSKIYTFRVPNRDTKFIDFFIETEVANGSVKSGSELAYKTLLDAAKKKLSEMTPEAMEEEARRRHDEIEADKEKRIAMYNAFIKPDK
jgi:hypothetical protein